MSEYVCELPMEGMVSFVSGTTTIPVREEVVRCRDCELFNAYHGKCHRPALVISDGKAVWTDEDEELMSLTDAVPDGFCSYAVRREG